MRIKIYSMIPIGLTALISLSALTLTTHAAEEPKRSADAPKAEVAQRQAAFNRAIAKIRADKGAYDRLAKAVKANSAPEVKEILAKNGFDASDIQFTLRDKTGGKTDTARKIKVTAEIHCCPWGGSITFTF